MLDMFVNFLTLFRVKERPKLVTTYKQITEMQYRCCPGYFGENCDMGKKKKQLLYRPAWAIQHMYV